MLWSPHTSIYQASLQGRSLGAAGRASLPRLELPQGKPCLLSDRLGPYEISFLINLCGSNAPEMLGQIDWLLQSAASFHLPRSIAFLRLSSQLHCEGTFTAPLWLTLNLDSLNSKTQSRCSIKCHGLLSLTTPAYNCTFLSEVPWSWWTWMNLPRDKILNWDA